MLTVFYALNLISGTYGKTAHNSKGLEYSMRGAWVVTALLQASGSPESCFPLVPMCSVFSTTTDERLHTHPLLTFCSSKQNSLQNFLLIYIAPTSEQHGRRKEELNVVIHYERKCA